MFKTFFQYFTFINDVHYCRALSRKNGPSYITARQSLCWKSCVFSQKAKSTKTRLLEWNPTTRFRIDALIVEAFALWILLIGDCSH